MASSPQQRRVNGLLSTPHANLTPDHMTKTSILLVDDDQEMTEMLAEYLQSSHFAVIAEQDGLAAVKRLERERFDLIILDVMLPSMDGFEVLKTIRKTLTTPVIMLTARGDDVDCVLGLELGADDYLSKPFSPRNLVARVRAVLRRSERAADSPGKKLVAGELTLDAASMIVTIKGKPLSLTGTEFRLLETLMEPVARTRSRVHLAERVLGRPLSAYDRSIDTHISNLRRKIAAHGNRSVEIRNMRGAGYVLVTGADQVAR
jgi:DNA-binding response OmpR family regulator